jgi:hypothetical protein
MGENKAGAFRKRTVPGYYSKKVEQLIVFLMKIIF